MELQNISLIFVLPSPSSSCARYPIDPGYTWCPRSCASCAFYIVPETYSKSTVSVLFITLLVRVLGYTPSILFSYDCRLHRGRGRKGKVDEKSEGDASILSPQHNNSNQYNYLGAYREDNMLATLCLPLHVVRLRTRATNIC